MDDELPAWGFEDSSSPFFVVDGSNPSTRLGGGAYGAVFEATLHGLPVAAKTLHSLRDPAMYGLTDDPAAAEAVRVKFNAEAEALAAVQHPNVLRFYGVCFSRSAPGVPRLPKWIVTELQPHSLHEFLRLPGMRVAIALGDHILLLSLDMADGLRHLHSLGIVHRDVKPKNILLGPDGAKVADLGTAKMVDIVAQTAQHTVGPGTAVYHPPEAITGRYSAAIDAFSLGMTVLETALCESPRREGAQDPVHAGQLSEACARLGRVPALEEALRGCCQLPREHRWTVSAMMAAVSQRSERRWGGAGWGGLMWGGDCR
jgi:serine/threonine protein kinase